MFCLSRISRTCLRFADNCWRPLCPHTHPGNGRSKRWSALWNLLAEQEDALHSRPRLLQIRRRDFSVKHWLPQWSGFVERTSADGDDIINATTVAAELVDMDHPPGLGGCAAGEIDGNDNATKVAVGLTQDGPPGNQSYNETKAYATQNALPGNQSHNDTNVNSIQDALPGNQPHNKTNANATQGEPPRNLSHNEMNANATPSAAATTAAKSAGDNHPPDSTNRSATTKSELSEPPDGDGSSCSGTNGPTSATFGATTKSELGLTTGPRGPGTSRHDEDEKWVEEIVAQVSKLDQRSSQEFVKRLDNLYKRHKPSRKRR